MRFRTTIIWAILSILAGVGCATVQESRQSQPESPYPDGDAGTGYTSAFPYRDISDQLNSVYRSVKRITITGVYRIYYFENQPVTLQQVRGGNLKKLASRSITKDQSVAGTAISIAQDRRVTTLLTCAHIVQFPDTVIEYVSSNTEPQSEWIQTVAIKHDQRNLINDDRYLAPFEIKSVNSADDLALIQVPMDYEPRIDLQPLSIPLGNSRDLKWGSFVLVGGYPKGSAVITRGIVSSPNRTERGDFLTDALFNPGMSGGIILASRDRFTSFEWVGIANTASAEQEYLLVPDPGDQPSEKLLEPYGGYPYVEKKTRVAYGITQAVPTADIIDFLNENAALFKNSISELPRY
ncbi:MAG: serine protease [Balneolaceae bacterium]|nr:serine protease [Balneolaceae bacterium]